MIWLIVTTSIILFILHLVYVIIVKKCGFLLIFLNCLMKALSTFFSLSLGLSYCFSLILCPTFLLPLSTSPIYTKSHCTEIEVQLTNHWQRSAYASGQRNVVCNKMCWLQCPNHCQFHSQYQLFQDDISPLSMFYHLKPIHLKQHKNFQGSRI